MTKIRAWFGKHPSPYLTLLSCQVPHFEARDKDWVTPLFASPGCLPNAGFISILQFGFFGGVNLYIYNFEVFWSCKDTLIPQKLKKVTV